MSEKTTAMRPRGQNIKVHVTYKNLMRQMAQTSGYNLYEIEDIMLHFVAAIQKNLRAEKTTQINGLGKFRVVTTNVPERYSAIVGRMLPANQQKKAFFVASDELKRAAKNISLHPDEEQADAKGE